MQQPRDPRHSTSHFRIDLDNINRTEREHFRVDSSFPLIFIDLAAARRHRQAYDVPQNQYLTASSRDQSRMKRQHEDLIKADEESTEGTTIKQNKKYQSCSRWRKLCRRRQSN